MLGTVTVAYAILNSFDFNSLNPTIVAAVKEATGRDLAMGQLDLQIGFTPKLVVENLAFRNPRWAHRLDLVRIRRLEIYVELLPLFSKKIVVKRLFLVEPDVQLEIAKSGLSNFDFTLSNKEEKQAISSPKRTELPQFIFHEILLKNVNLSLKRAESMESLALWLDSVEVTTKGLNAPIQLRLKGIHEKSAFEVEAITGSLEQLLRQDEPWPLEATIQALGAHSSVRGSIADLARIKGLNFTLTAAGPRTKEIRDLLNVELIPEIGAFKLGAEVSIPELGTYNISDLRLHSKETDISSSFQVRTGGKRPRISGMLYSQELDLRPFVRSVDSASKNQKGARVFSDKRMKPDMLAALDGEFKIRSKRIITPYGLMQNVQMDALLKDSCLTMRPLKATIGGGVAEVQGICRAEGSNVAVSAKIRIDELELNRLLKELQTDDVVDAVVGGELEFSTFGNSVRSLMANLNGKAIVSVGRGRIKNDLVRLFGAGLNTGLWGLFGSSRAEEITPLSIALYVVLTSEKGWLRSLLSWWIPLKRLFMAQAKLT